MTDLAEMVAALTARVAELEDREAITRLVASYGPAVDSGSVPAAGSLWVEDAVYDAGIVRFEGRAEIERMVGNEPHQGFIESGAAHIVSLPFVEVTGDTATATCYQQVIFRDAQADGYRIWRTSANFWEFTRTPEGWRVTRRHNRPLDGTAEARDLLGRSFTS